MTRDGEVKQRQHFYHHGDTICHQRSGYVTTKLYGASTCRCNNNAIFSDRAIFTFPTSMVWPCHGQRRRINAEGCNEVKDEGKEIKRKTNTKVAR